MILNFVSPMSGPVWGKKQKPSPPAFSCFSSTLHATPGDTGGSYGTDTMGQRTMRDRKALTRTQLRELSPVLFYSILLTGISPERCLRSQPKTLLLLESELPQSHSVQSLEPPLSWPGP